MSKPWWIFIAGATVLLAVGAIVWRENHRPWQAWQERYNLQPNVTPIAIGIKTLVPTRTGQPELCLTCHVGIEDISPSHPATAVGCVICHGGDPLALDAGRAHGNMHGGGNPSDLSVAMASCGTTDCHGGNADPEQNHVTRVLHSMPATYAGGIANVRYTFGAQASPAAQFAVHAVEDTSKPLPPRALTSLATLGTLHPIDAQLQQNCLTGGCHLWSPAKSEPYYYRSTGCATCHYLFDDEGLYRGNDPTIPHDQPGHGIVHRLTTAIPFTQCNHCHNRGTYSLKQMAFLPREDLPPAGPPLSAQMPAEGRRLVEYYQPVGDFTKCEIELNCIDCHTAQEVMGDGHIYGAKPDAYYVQCQTCHGTLTSAPAVETIRDANETAMRQARIDGHADFLSVGDQVVQTARGELLWSVKQTALGQFVQIDKVTGTTYKVPLVLGSRCAQDGSDQSAKYCHQCHYVTR